MRPPAALPLSFERLSPEESRRRALAFFEAVRTRRSVRDFSPEPVSRELIELAVRAACTAPSGANKQPWRFVAVSNPALKAEIRAGAEAEERESYDHRMGAEWLAALSARVYVPIEIYELAHHVSWLKAGALVLNLAILGYMIWLLTESRRRRTATPASA